MGEERNSLFIYKPLQYFVALHFGHPSHNMVNKYLRKSYTDKNEKKCVICLRAKQTQGTFSLSLNKATTIFNFIHFDLWGPYNTPSTFGAFHFLLFWTTIRDLCGFIYLLRKGKSQIL